MAFSFNAGPAASAPAASREAFARAFPCMTVA